MTESKNDALEDMIKRHRAWSNLQIQKAQREARGWKRRREEDEKRMKLLTQYITEVFGTFPRGGHGEAYGMNFSWSFANNSREEPISIRYCCTLNDDEDGDPALEITRTVVKITTTNIGKLTDSHESEIRYSMTLSPEKLLLVQDAAENYLAEIEKMVNDPKWLNLFGQSR